MFKSPFSLEVLFYYHCYCFKVEISFLISLKIPLIGLLFKLLFFEYLFYSCRYFFMLVCLGLNLSHQGWHVTIPDDVPTSANCAWGFSVADFTLEWSGWAASLGNSSVPWRLSSWAAHIPPRTLPVSSSVGGSGPAASVLRAEGDREAWGVSGSKKNV